MLQQLLNGLSIGSVYASLAVGFSLIFGVLDFPHFAHGITMMLAAYCGFFTAAVTNSLPLSILAVIVCGGLVSVLMDAFGYRFLRKKNVPRIYYLALSSGLCILFENLIINSVGASFLVYPSIFPQTVIKFSGLTFSEMDLIAFLMSIVLLTILSFVIYKTPLGLSVRAASVNMEATQLMGVSLNKTMCFVFLVAGIAAGFSGIILGVKYTVYPQMWSITNKVFIATVLGGMGSMFGAIVASLIIGILETFVTAYVSSEMSSLVVFVLLVLILVVRPQGLFGKIIEDKA